MRNCELGVVQFLRSETPVGTAGRVVVGQQGVVGLGLLVLVLPDGQQTWADRLRERIRFPVLRDG